MYLIGLSFTARIESLAITRDVIRDVMEYLGLYAGCMSSKESRLFRKRNKRLENAEFPSYARSCLSIRQQAVLKRRKADKWNCKENNINKYRCDYLR